MPVNDDNIVVIDDIKQGNNGPFILNFSNGTLNEKSKDSGEFSLRLYDTPTGRVMVAETDRLSYISKPSADPERSRTFLGVVKKNSGKMQLIEATTMNLHPYITREDEEEEMDTDETFQDTYRKRISKFGTKLNQRKLYNREKFGVGQTETVGKLSDEVVDTKMAEGEEQHNISLMPPCNRDATEVKDVYNVDDIIKPSLLMKLRAQLTELKQLDPQKVKTLSWICQLALFRSKEKDHESDEYLCRLLYLHYLISMAKFKQREFPPFSTVNTEVHKHMLKTYTAYDGRNNKITGEGKDKLCFDVIVLALTMFQYNLNLKFLHQDLSLTESRLRLLVASLGAKVTKDDIVKLSLPLAPKPKLAHTKKR